MLVLMNDEAKGAGKKGFHGCDINFAVTLTGVAVSDLKKRPFGMNRNVKRGPGHWLLVVHVAGMHPRCRAIEAPSGFRWRHSHAAEKGMQGNLDAGREMRDHCGAIQRNDLAAAIGIIIGQETPTGAKAVARKRHIYIDLENLDLEHVSGLSLVDPDRK